MKDYNGYVLVEKAYSARIWHAHLWNPETHECMNVACEDTDYDDSFTMGLVSHSYSPEDRSAMLRMPYFGGSKDTKKAYEAWKREEDFKAGRILEGFTVEVVKGRKYPIGTKGVVKGFSDYRDRYGRVRTTYVVTEDGKRIPTQNVVAVAM